MMSPIFMDSALNWITGQTTSGGLLVTIAVAVALATLVVSLVAHSYVRLRADLSKLKRRVAALEAGENARFIQSLNKPTYNAAHPSQPQDHDTPLAPILPFDGNTQARSRSEHPRAQNGWST
jgi:hypothetical protein